MADYTINAARDLKSPRNESELRSFVGLWTVYWQFVLNSAHLAAPFNMPKQAEMRTFNRLSQKEHHLFFSFQEKLVSAPVFVFPRREGLLTLEYDALNKYIGCVLMREQANGTQRPFS